MKRDHFCVSFLSDDREPHLSGPHSSEEEEDENTETEGIDVDDAEAGDFNKEEDAEEECIGGFWGGIDDLDNVAPVWNAMECEVGAVPNIRDSELSIIDSMSHLNSFGSEDVLTMFDRTIKQLKAVMEMKEWVRKITYKRHQQWTSKLLRNRDSQSEKGFCVDLQTH